MQGSLKANLEAARRNKPRHIINYRTNVYTYRLEGAYICRKYCILALLYLICHDVDVKCEFLVMRESWLSHKVPSSHVAIAGLEQRLKPLSASPIKLTGGLGLRPSCGPSRITGHDSAIRLESLITNHDDYIRWFRKAHDLTSEALPEALRGGLCQ